jgi:hypothetical protein
MEKAEVEIKYMGVRLPWVRVGIGDWLHWGTKDPFKMMKMFPIAIEESLYEFKFLKIHKSVHFKKCILSFVNCALVKKLTFYSPKGSMCEWNYRRIKTTSVWCSKLSSAPAAPLNSIPPGVGLMVMSRWIQEGRRKL